MTCPPANWRAVHSASEPTLVLVDGIQFEIPPVGTPILFGHLSTGALGQIIPGLLPESQMHQWAGHLLAPGSGFDMADATAIAEAVTEHITGVPAQTAVAMAAWVTADWLLVDGYFLGRGVDLLALPPRRAFAALYAFLVEHRFETRDEADRALFTTARPPTQAELDRDGENFLAAMAIADTMDL